MFLELCLLFFATTFRGDNPPSGWYIQQIPVNKQITDIYFTDTLNGWAVIGNVSHTDTGYILKTTNGGTNWLINYSNKVIDFSAIQFVSHQTGYTASGQYIMKTTNTGNNWYYVYTGAYVFTDLFFMNKDTGWVCDDGMAPFGVGLLKTTNGGLNWTQQMDNTYQPKKLFFLNKDTGWVMTNDRKLYRTMNSGNNWTQIYSFINSNQNNFFYTSIDTGWLSQYGTNYDDLLKTINGGYNWTIVSYPYSTTSHIGQIFMINSKYGYIGFSDNKVLKTVDGDNWKHQDAPQGYYYILYFTDSLHGWATHGFNTDLNIAATSDGGGPLLGVNLISSEVPDNYMLFQNYPNPFNSISKIKYQITKIADVEINVYDITGRYLQTLIEKRLNAGEYEVMFDGSSLSSGIYFYQLTINSPGREQSAIKKMILTK